MSHPDTFGLQLTLIRVHTGSACDFTAPHRDLPGGNEEFLLLQAAGCGISTACATAVLLLRIQLHATKPVYLFSLQDYPSTLKCPNMQKNNDNKIPKKQKNHKKSRK